jgi:hypothetical protein
MGEGSFQRSLVDPGIKHSFKWFVLRARMGWGESVQASVFSRASGGFSADFRI